MKSKRNYTIALSVLGAMAVLGQLSNAQAPAPTPASRTGPGVQVISPEGNLCSPERSSVFPIGRAK
jgi:hypothetical protein